MTKLGPRSVHLSRGEETQHREVGVLPMAVGTVSWVRSPETGVLVDLFTVPANRYKANEQIQAPKIHGCASHIIVGIVAIAVGV